MSSRDPLALGYHIKTTPDICGNIVKVRDLYEQNGIKNYRVAVQIFTKAPAQFAKSILPSREDLTKVRRFCDINDVYIVIHGIYLANFCNYDDAEKARQSVIEDLHIAEILSPSPTDSGVVIHLGKNTQKLTLEACILNFVRNIETIISSSPGKACLILETSVKAANGNDVFHDLENFAHLWRSIPSRLRSRIGFCIDTCHIFSSGYDVRSADGFERFMDEWDDKIGIRHIKLFHLNDSKLGLDCRRDLHEEIGRGCLFGSRDDALISILNFCKGHHIPVVMETKSDQKREFAHLSDKYLGSKRRLSNHISLRSFSSIPKTMRSFRIVDVMDS